MQDLVQGDATRGHPVRVQLNLKLTEITAETLNGCDAGNRQKTISDIELA
jgi:hypothetical protein